MKTILIKTVMCGMLVFAVAANTVVVGQNRLQVNNKTVNEVAQSKTIYRYDGALRHHLKYDYVYNNLGHLMEKKAFKWNGIKEEWNPYYMTSYSYSGNQMIIEHAYWNRKEKTYSKAKERNIYVLNDSDIPIASLGYKWDNSKNEWKIKDNSIYEGKNILFVSTE